MELLWCGSVCCVPFIFDCQALWRLHHQKNAKIHALQQQLSDMGFTVDEHMLDRHFPVDPRQKIDVRDPWRLCIAFSFILIVFICIPPDSPNLILYYLCIMVYAWLLYFVGIKYLVLKRRVQDLHGLSLQWQGAVQYAQERMRVERIRSEHEGRCWLWHRQKVQACFENPWRSL